MSAPVAERLWSRVVKTDAGCWEYTGHRNPQGYGSIGIGGKAKRAHRVAYELTKGSIPDGLVVMHSCDNPPCINPEHLSVGTIADNNNDAIRKGRFRGFAIENGQKVSCARGHEYSEANTYYRPSHANGIRQCRTCRLEDQRARKARIKAERVQAICGAPCPRGGQSASRKFSRSNLGWWGHCNRPVTNEGDRCWQHRAKGADRG